MTRQKAINAMCKWCIHDPAEPGTWRAQVENCTMTDCPLHPYRPKTVKSKIGPKQAKNEG